MPVIDIIARFRTNIGDFNKTMAMSLDNMKKMEKANVTLRSAGARTANSIRKFTHGLRGFRMEMLGVMFFGMGLQRFFSGLLRPALELTGIFQLWTSVLQILFLPIALLLLEFMMPLFDWLMNLSAGTKLMIGKLVLLGLGIGALLFLFGMFALGIGSVILAFAGVFLIIDKLIPDINVLGVNMSSFIEAGLGITILSTAWEFFKSIADRVLQTLFGFGVVKELMAKLNIEYDSSVSAWTNFKRIVKEAFTTLKAKIGLAGGDGDGSLGFLGEKMLEVEKQIEKWKRVIRLTFKIWKAKMEELGLSDFLQSIKDITTALVDLTPSLKTIAKIITTIADGFARIRGDPVSLIPGTSAQIASAAERFGLAKNGEVTQNLNFNPVVNVNTTGGVDMNSIKMELNELWAKQLGGISRRSG